ncbi:MAG: hypothetical protein ISS93_01330 [Candidatus Aenigmarchaeota archaeon]|nr:hypothetical protein [Candidatus Aenigmarchaeota archaeon]
MNRMHSIIIIFLLVIAILAVNEFVVFPIYPTLTPKPSCTQTSFLDLVNKSELIITGIAGKSTWVTREIEVEGPTPPTRIQI